MAACCTVPFYYNSPSPDILEAPNSGRECTHAGRTRCLFLQELQRDRLPSAVCIDDGGVDILLHHSIPHICSTVATNTPLFALCMKQSLPVSAKAKAAGTLTPFSTAGMLVLVTSKRRRQRQLFMDVAMKFFADVRVGYRDRRRKGSTSFSSAATLFVLCAGDM
jgi:hypothetical protein